MIAEAILGLIAEAVVKLIVEDSNIGQDVRLRIMGDPEAKAYTRALGIAFRKVEVLYPEEIASLFDKQFLVGTAVPILARCLSRSNPPDAYDLVSAWKNQFSVSPAVPGDLIRAASDLLSILTRELESSPEFQNLFDSRALDRTANSVERIAGQISSIAERTAPQHIIDPFKEHVDTLFRFARQQLRKTILNADIILLHSANRPDAILLPAVYVSQRPAWFSEITEPTQEFTSFLDAFDHHHQRVLLLGNPGAGKTTTLLAFARDKALERLNNPKAPLPIYAPIFTWDGKKDILEWLASTTSLTHSQLAQEIASAHALLLLDGLDELPTNVREDEDPKAKARDLRVDFLQAFKNLGRVPIVITCRSEDYEEMTRRVDKLPLSGAVALKPLTDLQIEHYLKDIPDLWTALRSDPDLRTVARTPLILTLLAVAYRSAGADARELQDLRASPVQLREGVLRTYVEKRYEHEYARSVDAREPLMFSLEQVYSLFGDAIITSLSGTYPQLNEIPALVFDQILLNDSNRFINLIERLLNCAPVSGQGS